MRRACILVAAMLAALMGMSAAATADAETITSIGKNYYAVLFSNGYTGFCIDRLLNGTTANKEFSADDAAAAVSNVPQYTEAKADPEFDLERNPYHPEDDSFYTDLSVAPYLKAAIVHSHNKLFTRDGNGGYYDTNLATNRGINTGSLFWTFTDSRFMDIYEKCLTVDGVNPDAISSAEFKEITNFSPTGDIVEVVLDAIDRVHNKHEIIPDHSEKRYVIDSEGTEAQFDFMVLDSKDSGIQDYFCFKITYYRKAAADKNTELVMNAGIPNGRGLSYQWAYEDQHGNFIDMPGETEETLSVNPVAESDDGKRYRCIVVCGDRYTKTYEIETVFTVHVNGVEPENNPPVISSPALDQEISRFVGEKAELTVQAQDPDGDALTYTWYKQENGGSAVLVEGKNTDKLTIEQCTDADNGDTYYCVVSDGKDNAASRRFTLKIKKKSEMPKIESLIVNDAEVEDTYAAENGTNVKMRVTAAGTELTYQWSVKNSGETEYTNISGATDAAYDFGTVTAADNGKTFRCIVTNDAGTAAREFVLKVSAQDDVPPPDHDHDDPPAYVLPAKKVEIAYTDGEKVTLTMPREDGGSVRFAWYAVGGDGEPELIDEAEGDTFVIDPCKSEHDGLTMVCVSSDGAGSSVGLAFRLAMKPAGLLPVVISPEKDVGMTLIPGERVTLSIAAEHAAAYRWMVDKGTGSFEEIPGALSSSYTVEIAGKKQDGWKYVCQAINAFGSDFSPAFILNVENTPDMPATGDQAMPLLWLSTMLFSAAVCLYMLRRRSVG